MFLYFNILLAFLIIFGNVHSSEQNARNVRGLTEKLTVKTPHYQVIAPKVRLKDISHFSDVRENQLVGYGLVVGLPGTGDTLSSAPYTKESLTSMLERLGVNIRDGKIPSGKNVAAVMVTATLKPFAKRGSRIDVKISSLGDAKYLNGGTLLVTPLLAADGEVYAVAQGALSVSGFKAQGRAASQTKGVPTSGKISNGAIVEKEIGFKLTNLNSINLVLNNPDFTTAQRISDAINIEYKKIIARALDSSTVSVDIPKEQSQRLIAFMTEIEQVSVKPDLSAKVVIDDHSGVITITSDVRVSPIALTHGSLNIKIVESPKVFLPPESKNRSYNNIIVDSKLNDPNTKASDYIEVMIKQHNHQIQSLKEEQKEERKMFKNLYQNYERVGTTQNDLYKQLTEQQSIRIQKLKLEQEKQMNNLVESQKEEQKEKSGDDSLAKSVGNGVAVDSTLIDVKEEKGRFTVFDGGVSLEELVNALNSLGVSPSEMASILQNIKAAGALQAEIIMV